jgi:MFS family permease
VASPLLQSRDGRLLLEAQSLSFTAHGISSVALPWLVLEGDGSTLAAGLVFTFTVLPYVLFGIPAGIVGDRHPSRSVLWTTHAAQALVALVVPLWSFAGNVPVAIVLAAAFAIGTGRVFSDAAVFGALVEVAGKEGVVHAQATLGAAWAVGLLAGPALGGVLIAAIGPAHSLIVEAAALALATLVVRRLRIGRTLRHAEQRLSAREIVRGGLHAIFVHPVLRATTATGASWCFVAAGTFALAVPLLRDELDLRSGQVGIILAAGAAMGILASPIVGWLHPRIGGLRIIVLGVPVSGVATGVLGMASGFALGLVAYCAMQLADTVTTAAFIGERQRRAPIVLQATTGIFGRMIIMLSLALGSAVASALTDVVTLRELYVGIGVATLVVWILSMPVLLRFARGGQPATLEA